ncbi:MAG: hypothetical protein WD768_00940 [Phycisphaeraceae bacterium]
MIKRIHPFVLLAVVATVTGCAHTSTYFTAQERAANEELFARTRSLLVDLPPAGATFVKITLPFDAAHPDRTVEVRGWRVSETDRRLFIYSPFGTIERFSRNEDGLTRMDVDLKPPVVSAITMDRAVADLESWASTREPLFVDWQLHKTMLRRLSPNDPAALAYQLTLALWLHDAGRRDLSDTVLRRLLYMRTRGQLNRNLPEYVSEGYGYGMLIAFVGDRDYSRALRLAKLIAPTSHWYPIAQKLQAELPLRMDDYTTMTLPGPRQWSELKEGLSHESQVRFLCERLRLINSFQLEQAGVPDLTWRQYANASGMSANAAWSLREPREYVIAEPKQPPDVVINPYVELTGKQSEFSRGVFPAVSPLKLSKSDIAIIAPYLKQDWYLPTVEFGRGFQPDRGLADVRAVLCEIINDLAGERVCDGRAIGAMSATELDAFIQRLVRQASQEATAQ